MAIQHPRIEALRAAVKAAHEEFELAIRFHEVWKPTAYDRQLHKRMGNSHASHAFLIVRASLRREMLLALMRIWDKRNGVVQIEVIGRELGNESLIEALAADRAVPFGQPSVQVEMQKDLSIRAHQVLDTIAKYSPKGSHRATFEKIQRLRHEHLAHRKITPTTEPTADASDEDIESFYQDTAEIISALLSVVSATGYSADDTAGVIRYYAELFWEGARGERTEGHPNYKAPPAPKRS